MPKSEYRKGDVVQFRIAYRIVRGVVKEDRGPIGVKGRHLYLVEFEAEPPSPNQIELPAVDLELAEPRRNR